MDKEKLMQLYDDIENIEDFIKVSAADNKIETRTANEILRITREARERALK